MQGDLQISQNTVSYFASQNCSEMISIPQVNRGASLYTFQSISIHYYPYMCFTKYTHVQMYTRALSTEQAPRLS